MPINYLRIQPQITDMATAAAKRQHQIEDRLQLCLELLHQYADRIVDLQKAVLDQSSGQKSLRCALPFTEYLTTHQPAKTEHAPCKVISADGSQITPDPHAAFFYGLVNVGVFHMPLGKGETPHTEIRSDLIYEVEDLEENIEHISEELINLRRDVFERQILAELAKKESAPLVTLTDGPLELYHEPRNEEIFRRYFGRYIAALQELALLETIPAGYIDRPRAALLVNLLELVAPASLDGQRPQHPFAGVSDLDLMSHLLLPGERSAVFTLQSSSSNKYEGKLALHFFYLNVAASAQPTIARVEIPLWVASSNEKVDLLQSVLVEQAAQAGAHPYPYALTRAHETAVVKMDEHEYLENLIQQELIARGLPVSAISEKLMNKLVGKRTRY